MNFRLSYKNFLKIKGLIWLLYILFCIYSLTFINKAELLLGVFFGAILLQLSLITFINHWYKYRQPKLLDWFRLGTFVSIILNFYSLISIFNLKDYIIVNKVVQVDVNMLLPTLIVLFIGLLALNLGEFLLTNYKKPKSSVKSVYVFRHINIFFLTTILTIGIEGYLLLQGITGYGVYEEYTTGTYSFLLQTLGILTPFILAIYSVLKFIHKYNKLSFNILFAVFFVAQIGFGFLSGMKEEIITPIIVVAIPYLIGGYKVPKKVIYLSVLFVVLLYPINNNYRTILNESTNVDKITAFQLSVVNTFNQDLIDSVSSGAESYQSRFSLFPILMYSISIEDKWTSYKHLNRYLYLPLGWIVPRFILPNKPISNTGAQLNYMLTGNNKSSITPSTYGWSFFEGGYVFVFLTFFVFGLIISYLQQFLDMHNLYHLVLYIVVLVSLLKVESDIYFRISSLLQTVFIGYLVCVFFFKTKTIAKI